MDDIYYEVHIPTETPELAGRVMHAAGPFGGFGARGYAIEDDRRRPVRFKELERMLHGATAYQPEQPDESEPAGAVRNRRRNALYPWCREARALRPNHAL